MWFIFFFFLWFFRENLLKWDPILKNIWQRIVIHGHSYAGSVENHSKIVSVWIVIYLPMESNILVLSVAKIFQQCLHLEFIREINMVIVFKTRISIYFFENERHNKFYIKIRLRLSIVISMLQFFSIFLFLDCELFVTLNSKEFKTLDCLDDEEEKVLEGFGTTFSLLM